MIFVRSGAKAGTAENTGRVQRSTFATTSSEGGMAGFMVRSQLRKQRQTSEVVKKSKIDQKDPAKE